MVVNGVGETFVQQRADKAGRLLDGTTRHVDHGETILSCNFSGVRYIPLYVIHIGVVRVLFFSDY